ncbi:MAG TPA: LptA/OstA family protein [Bryobacteraceae bacterium]|nr:LptA/OstA family protein [Bryobacteraceae bacterium]
MRGTRWLILLAIGAILGGVGLTYRVRKSALEREAPARPKALPLDLLSTAQDWEYSRTFPGEGRRAFDIKARKYGQAKDNSLIALEQVELRVYHKNDDLFDLVKCARAEFQTAEKRLYSDGEVQITLSQPRVSIRSSGVTFDTTTGKVWTERATEFTFENGTGRSVGASYDPMNKRLQMTNQAVVDWKAVGRRAKPMRIEAGDLTYEEADEKVWLRPWAKLTRGESVIESAAAVVTLVDGDIRKVEAVEAHGADRYPERVLEYAARELWAEFSEEGAITKVIGSRDARLVSTTGASATTVTSDRVDLDFLEMNGESTLTRALATGKAVLEAKPLPAAGRQPAETRLLRSETIAVKMRPGGREIATLETHAPGTLEFRPNTALQRHRTLEGERMTIDYGPGNLMESFRSVNVVTRTEPTAEERKRNRVTAITRSKNLKAGFTPKTGQLATLEQWDDFHYEEADRKARADRATLDQAANVVLLEARARVEDATGSTSADHIRLDQRNGDFVATGHVNSSRQPDRKPGSQMLSGQEAMQAVAAKMTTTNQNRLVLYEGSAVLWQGANRIESDRVEIDREKRRLTAAGNVVSQFLEEREAGKGAPLFTVVKAPKLVYTEADRLAHYTGGAALTRPGLQVKGAEIRARLAEQGAASRIERADADGKVEIEMASPGRNRKGSGDHAEYWAAEQKIIMRGGAEMVDSRDGTVKGDELTYYANDDRLLVTGAPERPAKSRIRRK